MTEPAPIGLLGARSLVGDYLLQRLGRRGRPLLAFTRHPVLPATDLPGLRWQRIPAGAGQPALLPTGHTGPVPDWLCLAPIWTLPAYFPALQQLGVQRLVALSSTSRFSKQHSASSAEQQLARQLIEGEQALADWAAAMGIHCTLLRPTLIYDGNQDQNIAVMRRFIQRFHFFPTLGAASGQRQPLHADDVAQACLAALDKPGDSAGLMRAYNLSGGETLSYRAMVERLFVELAQPVRILPIPLWLFRAGLLAVRWHPRYRHWTPAMASRMNQDLVFDHSDARRELDFQPRPFLPGMQP